MRLMEFGICWPTFGHVAKQTPPQLGNCDGVVERETLAKPTYFLGYHLCIDFIELHKFFDMYVLSFSIL